MADSVMRFRGQKAYAYLRVSGKGQVEGHGFDRQLDAIKTWATWAGVEISDGYVFRDCYTGTDADRPKFMEMLEAILGNGVRLVVVESLDRFARSLAVQVALIAKLQEYGVSLISATTGECVTDGGSDEMREALVLIQGVFNQLEKKRLVRKLRLARDAMRDRDGRCEGPKPYGELPGEGAVLERLLLFRSSGMSYRQIAAAMNAAGIPPRRGRLWTAGSACAIVKRAAVVVPAVPEVVQAGPSVPAVPAGEPQV